VLFESLHYELRVVSQGGSVTNTWDFVFVCNAGLFDSGQTLQIIPQNGDNITQTVFVNNAARFDYRGQDKDDCSTQLASHALSNRNTILTL